MKCPENILDKMPDAFVIELICFEDIGVEQFHLDFILTYHWGIHHGYHEI